MKGKHTRAKIGDPVKAGFLTLYVVGHIHQGRLLRDATGTKYYWQLHYCGVHKASTETDAAAQEIIAVAAPFDPIVKSFVTNFTGERR